MSDTRKSTATRLMFTPHCWFCGWPQHHTGMNFLIAGPQGIHICDQCVVVCVGVLAAAGCNVILPRVVPPAVDTPSAGQAVTP
jgi:hypothetical protein